MCQLIFVNSNNLELNRILTFAQMERDSRSFNRDGWGIYTKDIGGIRFHFPIDDTKEFGDIVHRTVVNYHPVMAHVRQATKGIELRTDHNHPFIGKEIVLAHNGTLESKSGLETTTYKDKNMIDSQIFLAELEKNLGKVVKGTDRVFTAVEKTMKGFTGKFALLIFDLVTGKYYAFRGKTADLHVAYFQENGENIGYIINTNKLDLLDTLGFVQELRSAIGKPFPDVTEPVLLQENTGFLLGKCDLTVLGKVEQNIKPVEVVRTTEQVWGVHSYGSSGKDAIIGALPEKSKINLIVSFMNTFGFCPEEIDDLFLAYLGIPSLEMVKLDLENFTKYLIPALSKKIKKDKRKEIKKILSGMPYHLRADAYESGPYQFPYMLEPDLDGFIEALEMIKGAGQVRREE